MTAIEVRPPQAEGLIRLGGRPRLGAYLRATWQRRDFATAIAVGELRSQNMNTVLGNFWHLLNPVLLVGIYWLVFGVILDISRGTDNFVAFLTIGVFMFHYTQKSVQRGATSIVSNEGLIRSIRFPRAVLPLSTVIGHTIAFLPGIALMVLVALATGERVTPYWLLLAPILVVQGMFNIGATLIAARLTDLFRDFAQILPFVFRVLFYVSGVFWSIDRFINHPRLREVFTVNPLYCFLELVRDALMHGTFQPRLALTALAWTAGVLVAGFLYFVAGEHRYGRA